MVTAGIGEWRVVIGERPLIRVKDGRSALGRLEQRDL
jgi:hypothetical protein